MSEAMMPSQKPNPMVNEVKKLHRRIALGASVILAIMAASCIGVFTSSIIQEDLAQQRRILEQCANAYNQPASDFDDSSASKPSFGKSPNVIGLPHVLYVQTDSEGRILDPHDPEADDPQAPRDLSERLIASRAKHGSRPFYADGKLWIGMWVPAEAEAQPLATRVYCFLDITEHGQMAQRLMLTSLVAWLALTLIMVLVVFFTTKLALAPVKQSIERERDVLTKLSHELKTPLMAITATCDVLEQETDGEHEMRTWILHLRESIDDLAFKVGRLLNSSK